MPETRTFGRYAEIPYEQMTPEQQEGYRFVKETGGHIGITDAVTLMGYFTSVSMTLAFYDASAGALGMAR